MSFNKVILEGHLGADPAIKETSNGKAVAEFSLATNSKTADGKHVDWHRIKAWERLAKTCQYLRKGSRVLVDGRIQYRSYEKDGQKKWITEIIAHQIEFLDKAPALVATGTDGKGLISREEYQRSEAERTYDNHRDDQRLDKSQDYNDNDIPF
jgi:single-strand DNA-binding protein